MNLESFLTLINSTSPIDLATESLNRNEVHAIPNAVRYKAFLEMIADDYKHAAQIAIMGSGNWKFSLNPKKNYSEYHRRSDIDVAIICESSFEKTWEELRSYHRNNYYLIPEYEKTQLRRNGENVYSGFVSPKWIPATKSAEKFNYLLNSNKYSNNTIGFRTVNMMYFKNRDEAIDYYVRGFSIAQNRKQK